ncbi:cytochrome c peroxidase [Lysobacter sp. CCNWLW3]|uniref:cytochrome-c peroxidase n=1 Tax=unclassified Lysobacter TaxID=2635362 RepID=UPI002FD24274
MNRFGASQLVVAACLALLAVACAPRGDSQAARDATNAARVALGKRVFLDARLSDNGKVSCASCHNPRLAFADGRVVSLGVHGKSGTRNAPSLLENATKRHFFWDGRESSLEAAVLQPFVNPVEMGLNRGDTVIERMIWQADYPAQLQAAFPDSNGRAGIDQVGIALAAYLRSLPGADSAFDRHAAGEADALSADQQAGLALFRGKAQCSQCHRVDGVRANFSDDDFHHLGVSDSAIAGRVAQLVDDLPPPGQALGDAVLTRADIAGLGRFAVTRKPRDLAAFRTPSLRNVAVTAPYMHDGSVATLEAAVDQEIYYRSLKHGRPISLTVAERRQLLAFLSSLTDSAYASAP